MENKLKFFFNGPFQGAYFSSIMQTFALGLSRNN